MSLSSCFSKPAAMSSDLLSARALQLPSREETLRRDSKVYDFWNQNEDLLVQAWKEWQNSDPKATALPPLNTASLLNPKLRQAVEAAWENPSAETEKGIKDLWEEVAPGVFTMQFWDSEKMDVVRAWFDAAAESGIPTRPPYGIVLNRKGFMTDPRSVGYLAAPDFQSFYRDLVDTYIRPLGRLFFPSDILGENDDLETFSFSIQYQGEQGGDKSIRHHTDASTLTFNINLDKECTWKGSSLIFFENNKKYPVEWAPGYAVMHLGRSMHAAVPIESGTRSNWIIWTFGKGGPGSYGGPLGMMGNGRGFEERHQTTPEERWTKPEGPPAKVWDRWLPF